MEESNDGDAPLCESSCKTSLYTCNPRFSTGTAEEREAEETGDVESSCQPVV